MPDTNGAPLPEQPDTGAEVYPLHAYEVGSDLTDALKRVVRTAAPKISGLAVARIAAGLVQVVGVLRDEAATTVLTRPVDLENDEITQILDEVVTETELRDALIRRNGVDTATHGVNLARRLLGQFHAERCSGRSGGSRTQMVARFELTEFTDRMNDLATIEREVQA